MHTIEIPAIGYRKEIPSDISEMDQSQFVHFTNELLKLHRGEISMEDFKTSLVLNFLEVKHRSGKFRKMPEDVRLQIGENIYRVGELLDYFFDHDPKSNTLQLNLAWTRNFIPSFRIGLTWFRGPEDALTDITFAEYKNANAWFRKYSESRNEEDLSRMIAVLYRPVVFGKKRKYDPSNLERSARKIGRLPRGVRYGIYLFFLACENFLRSGEIDADGHKINLELLYRQTLKEKRLAEKRKYNADTGLISIAYNMAETGIIGNLEAVMQTNLYDLLVLLYQKRIEYLNSLENLSI